MARIIYGINAEGLGHATRSKPTIDYLMKRHDVMIVTSAAPYDFLKQYYNNLFKTKGFNAVYEKNKLNIVKSLIGNLKNSEQASFLKDLNKLYKDFKPDILISDLEPLTALMSIFKNLPLINIDNQGVYIVGDIKPTAKDRLNFLATKNFVKTWLPHADYYFICSFFEVEFNKKFKKKDNAKFIKPILRDEVIKLKKGAKAKDYILVYQTTTNNYELLDTLSKVKHKFYTYKLPQVKKFKNIFFRDKTPDIMFEDLKNCKAIITNGGFSLMSEALYLGKPVLSFPIAGIYEQKLNAIKLQELEYGEFHEAFSAEIIENFIERIPMYKKNLSRYQGMGNKELFKSLDILIPKLIKEKQKRKNKIKKIKAKLKKLLKKVGIIWKDISRLLK